MHLNLVSLPTFVVEEIVLQLYVKNKKRRKLNFIVIQKKYKK